ncbi:hypothetical protein M426DRAFT_322230 [Hypoxylon sp. CI-4A]|nr:hypothetical protein M426DRAFT_322230 [Hypoxylon sp. CI-4A]
MESKTNRYQSRILREMHQNTENPFNSPPSSTGSHGTITLTSNITMGPQCESTRQMDDLSINLPSQATKRSAKAPQPTSINVDTSALGRAFPEWSRWDPNGSDHDKDEWDVASNASHNLGKENVTPRGSPNSSIAATPRMGESERRETEAAKVSNASKSHTTIANRDAARTRAQMQPRVQTESECSLDLSEQFAQSQQNFGDHGHRRVSAPNASKGSKQKRGNVTALLETLKTAQTKQAESTKEQSSKHTSPRALPSIQPLNAAKMHMERQSGMSHIATPSSPNQTARSFFLPDLSYMNDFLSGALRLSSLRNGMPVFVRHGKVYDRESAIYPDRHADIEAIAIPEDEEKIFVSLDKIKDEVHALKEHDELVSKQAEQLQEEVEELHIQIAKYKSRKDSAMGSDSESSIIDHLSAQKSQLEDQVSSLQARLDKANRKISINEIHTESYIAERDEALKGTTEHLDKIKQLQSELNLARQQLALAREDNTQDADALDSENRSLRKDNNSIRQQWKSLLDENRSLREHNSDVSQRNVDLERDLKTAKTQFDSTKSSLQRIEVEYAALLEERNMLKQDNASLEQHNDKFFNDSKVLKQQNSLLERRTHDLADEVSRLQQLLDATGAENMSVDFKDIKYRLEVRNRELTKENQELQNEIIDLNSEFRSARKTLEQDKRRLNTANQHLKEQIQEISNCFERVVKDSKDEFALYDEHQAALTQQIEIIADKESALVEKLKKTTDNETALQSELKRRTDAINEARQITQEIKDFMSTVSKNKQTKNARIVEPKGKSTYSETTARTTTQSDMPIQDDYTQQIDLTQGSEYASIFTQGEMPRLRDSLRQVRNEKQPRDLTNESSAFGDDDDVSEPGSPDLPPLFIAPDLSPIAGSQRSFSRTSKARSDMSKPQPIGILKDSQPSRLNLPKQKTVRTVSGTGVEETRERDRTTESTTGLRKSKLDDTFPRKVSFGRPGMQNGSGKMRAEKESRPVSEPELTGRFSVKSGASGMSIQSETPDADKFLRRNSDSVRFDLESDHEDNMTSALFIDDITLEEKKLAEKQKAKKTSKPELSEDAKRVLDNLCHDHDCRNCFVCSRINSHNTNDGKKKTVRADRPHIFKDWSSKETIFRPDMTLRPSQDPMAALSKVIKSLRDEEDHLISQLRKKDEEYNNCDPAVHRRVWKQLDVEIAKLRKARDLKRDQIYFLNDAALGQEKKGEELTSEFLECTVMSAMSMDETWNGILEF